MNEDILLSKFKGELRNFIRKRVKDPEDAKDILQDSLLKIYLHYSDLKNRDKLTSWVYQITRNTIIDFYRKSKKSIDISKIDLPEKLADDSELNHELAVCIRPFIQQLPTKYRDALLQTDLGNLSQKQFSEKSGISYSGTKSRVQRGRSLLKKQFQDCCTIEADKYGHILDYSKRDLCC